MSLPPAFVLPTRTRTFVKSPFRDFASVLVDPVAIGVRPPFALAGYDPTTFLGGMTVRREAWVEGARVGELLAAAAQHPAVDATADPGQALWFHPVRRSGPGFQTAQHLLVVSGHVRYAANAQFDLAHFDQANFEASTLAPIDSNSSSGTSIVLISRSASSSSSRTGARRG